MNYTDYMQPVLDALRAMGGSGKPSEVTEAVAKRLKLGASVTGEKSESGQNQFQNRVAWARFYLVKSGHIDGSVKGVWTLTTKGKSAKSVDTDKVNKLAREASKVAP